MPNPTDKAVTERSESDASGQAHSLTKRSIRSFVVRNGRVTGAQRQALESLFPRYGLPVSNTLSSLPAHSGPDTSITREPGQTLDIQTLDIKEAFGRTGPLWIEIGFGNGDALLHMAQHSPDSNLLGIEVHAAGIGHALMGLDQLELENIRIIQHDAMEVLEQSLPAGCAERVLLFFPDPWHKKRHHKRRIVQPEFLDAVARVLSPGGMLHCATDWEDYAVWMLEHIEADSRFVNQAGAGERSERPDWRPQTRFEKRGLRLGHQVSDLIYRYTGD